MAKEFNVTADCKPELHYMVNIDKRLLEIKQLVDAGKYFTINRARQYGKTTTLRALSRFLQSDYYTVLIDLQVFGNEKFKNENIFSITFASSFLRYIKRNKLLRTNEFESSLSSIQKDVAEDNGNFTLMELFERLSEICEVSDKKIVMLIDEIDSAANNQVFLDFLSQLRACYIDRDVQSTFQSVILTGVYDVKNLKRKIRPDDDHKVNSPWNIAADFTIDMSLSEEGIVGMLSEYEADHHTGMDIKQMAKRLYEETSGYPFLVSRLCKLMDEEISKEQWKGSRKEAWTLDGFMDARRILTSEKNTLFESLIGKVIGYPELDNMLRENIFNGQSTVFTTSNPVIDLAVMFGIIKNGNGVVIPANKIFDTLLSDHF